MSYVLSLIFHLKTPSAGQKTPHPNSSASGRKVRVIINYKTLDRIPSFGQIFVSWMRSMSEIIKISGHLMIPLTELQFKFSRSGGKGGQNVNKVETRVELLFDLKRSQTLTGSQRDLIMNALGRRIDTDGVLHIVVQESRSQWRNREIAVNRFAELLDRALRRKKKRIATRHTAGSREKRLTAKKHRGTLKQSRKLLE